MSTPAEVVTAKTRPAVDPALATEAFLRLIPRDFSREHVLLSQGDRDGEEWLAVASTSSPAAIFNVGVRLSRPVRTLEADAEEIARAIDLAYGNAAHAPNVDALDCMQEAAIENMLAAVDRDLLSTQGKGPIVKLVDFLLFDAVGRGASDVHVQPLAGEKALVRYRVDGALHTVRELEKGSAHAVVSRIKVMGQMDIAEHRVAQDGRASVTIGEGRSIDLRISTFPTSHGERAVLRLLDNSQPLFSDFLALGMPQDTTEKYLAAANRASGIVLVTGPTGSGKTTTLYATLKAIATSDLNVMTIEDPIEYELSHDGLTISQSQVNAKKGVTFSSGLRHILRQDPDVILVGEIRDAETAKMAIQSSLTGHLVFATLHTNDAPSALTRLFDLGVEPYLVSSSISAVLAQRLVRRVHPPCRGQGCELCFGAGLLGRTGVFELMVLDERIQSLVAKGVDVLDIRKAAREQGMRTLREAAARLVADGITRASEVARVLDGAFA